jgi:pyridoxamine 5'-phosphate oxidase
MTYMSFSLQLSRRNDIPFPLISYNCWKQEKIMDINDLRKEYGQRVLSRSQLADSPFDQFRTWFADALNAKLSEPNAMALATATIQGKPACRMILMKHFDEQGVVFFTNYNSRKAHELHDNPYAAVAFYWQELERQVRIEGTTQKISQEESKNYFATRPRGSQIGAWASQQDCVISSREVLEKEYVRIDALYRDNDIPLPPFWGGYRIIPSCFEFWQGSSDRLHDRFLYTLQEGKWVIVRLSP